MTMWWEMMTLRVHRWHLPQRHRGKCIYLRGTQHNRCCECVKTRTNAYRETCLHLFARSASDSLQLRTNWSQTNRNDTARYWPVRERYRVPPQRLPFKGGVLAENKREESTKVAHLFRPRPPDSGAWLFAFGTPTNACFFSQVLSKKKSNPKCALELPMGAWPWSTAPCLFLSFTHLFFLSQSPHSADVGRWQWERFEGRDEGEECWWVVCPCHLQLMAHLSLCGWSRVKRDAFWSVTQSAVKTALQAAALGLF